jgi:CxxC motif-containing protein (DUF1111 family)
MAVNVGLQEAALDGEESDGEQGWTNMQRRERERESDIGRYGWLGV